MQEVSSVALPVLLAPFLGAVLGLFGAARNQVRFGDERLLWVLGGALGASLSAVPGALLGPQFNLTRWQGAASAMFLWSAGSVLGSLLTPGLDASDRPATSFASILLKWAMSPLTTSAGLLAALAVAARRRRVRLARGTLFIEVGRGGSAAAVGAVVWACGGFFDDRGRVRARWSRHEAFHTRTVAAIGEWGFYLAYALAGLGARLVRGAPWNSVDAAWRGNPFEKTAYTLVFQRDARGRAAATPPPPKDASGTA